MSNNNSGMKTFALVAAMVLVLSFIRMEPNGTALSAGVPGQFGGEVVTEELSEEELAALEADPEALQAAVESGEIVIDESGKPKARRVLTGGSAGQAGTAGSSGSGGTSGSTGGKSGGGVSIDGGTSGTGGAGSGGGGGGGFECKAGKNGGATDTGVSGTSIKLATTAVLDGPAKSLLEPSVTGIKAVFDKVNKAGGICGRRLELKVDNDSFDKSRGQQIIRNYIEGDYFALPVVPSAEGLGAMIETGEITKAGIPVVGTDGMRQEQYGDAWVWPVAAATTTSMRVMAKYAADVKKAETFAVVYDQKYKFGVEGKEAFEKQVKAMGKKFVHAEALEPTSPSYASEVNSFNGKCGSGGCDMVALLLLPDTAQKWMAQQPAMGKLYTAGAQTLFTDQFARNCVQAAKDLCHGLAVWTGYNPPIGTSASKPGVSTYVNDVRALNPNVDVNNQFLQGAYLGASVFVEALKKVGPNLTRENLKAALDSMTYQSDLASPLTWKAGNHRANVRAQSFSMQVGQGTFTGWRNDSGFVADPNPGG